jgi:hypothetical protein
MDAFKSIDKHNENALSFTDLKGGFEFILFVCCDHECILSEFLSHGKLLLISTSSLIDYAYIKLNGL